MATEMSEKGPTLYFDRASCTVLYPRFAVEVVVPALAPARAPVLIFVSYWHCWWKPRYSCLRGCCCGVEQGAIGLRIDGSNREELHIPALDLEVVRPE